MRYFHVVFTIPHHLNPLARTYPGKIYNILFKAAWSTVKTLGEDPKWIGAHTGMIALLHTWGQNLSLHPHLHCIIPQGGFIPENKRWVYTHHRAFLFPVRVMSALYRKFFLRFLEETYADPSFSWKKDDWNNTIATLRNSSFNVFAKLPFNGPQQVIDYLGRYSHRVAITNHRITHVSKDQVRFTYRDYRDNSEKFLSLTPSEFARRFLQHILPRGFAKIRHYGILSNRAKSNTIPDILFFFEQRQRIPQKFNPVAYFLARYAIDITLCPICRSGHLIRRLSIPRSRGDPQCKSLSHSDRTHHRKTA